LSFFFPLPRCRVHRKGGGEKGKGGRGGERALLLGRKETVKRKTKKGKRKKKEKEGRRGLLSRRKG